MQGSQLTDITIVIPSYERPEFLKRSMLFWDAVGINLIVVDGSDTPLPSIFLDSLKRSIRYFHLPISFEKRLQVGMHAVDTPFVAMIGDDEFFTVEGLLACRNELVEDKNLVSCTGICWDFYVQDHSLHFTERYVNWLDNCSIGGDDSFSRIRDFAENGMSAICYSLVRTSSWKNASDVISVNPDGVTFLTEIFIELVIAFEGKTKVIDKPYWIRSIESESHWETQATVSIEKWLKDPRYRKEREEYLDTFASVCKVEENLLDLFKAELYSALDVISMRTSGIKNSSLNRYPFLERIVTKMFIEIPPQIRNQKFFEMVIAFLKKTFNSHHSSDYRGLQKGGLFEINLKGPLKINSIFGHQLPQSMAVIISSLKKFYKL